MGSFYSSLVANLLPTGVGDAVREADCPKVYVPNSGGDPEMKGLSAAGAAAPLFRHLAQGRSKPAPRDSLLNFVLVDRKNGDYGGPIDTQKIRRFGVEIIDADLTTEESRPRLDATKVLHHLRNNFV